MGGVNAIAVNPDYSRSYENPDATELIEAIEWAINNPEELAKLRENGLRMIKAFDKKHWDAKISKIIERVYGKANE